MTDDQKPQETQPPAARQPVFLLPGVVTAIAGLFVAVHVAAGFLDPAGYEQLIIWFGFLPLRLGLFSDAPGGVLPLVWTPVTHAFLHAGWDHLLINTAWFAIFATPIARRYGPRVMVGIFLLSAIAGAAAFTVTALVLGPSGGVFLVGASGGVAGLTGAATRFIFQPVVYGEDPATGERVPLGRRLATLREVLANSRSRWFALIWVILNTAVPFLPMLFGMDTGIAWQAHLGGFFAGLLLIPLFERRT